MKNKEQVKVFNNGLTLLFKKTKGFYSSKFSIRFCVGSSHEDLECGISHLLEHEMFKGTKHHSYSEIAGLFHEISANQNACTTKSYTEFYATLPAKNMERCFDIFSEMLTEPLFDEVELEKEKNVIHEEMCASADRINSVGYDVIDGLMFKGSGYDQRILGKWDLFKNITRDDLIAFMDKYYVANNAIISIIGDFEFDYLIGLVEKYFVNKLKLGEKLELKEITECEPKEISVKYNSNQLLGIIGYYGPSIKDDNRFKLNIVLDVLGGSFMSRLMEEVRFKNGLVYSIFAAPDYFVNMGDFIIFYKTNPKNVEKAEKLIFKEIDKLAVKGITDDEFNKSRDQIIDSILMSEDKPEVHTSSYVVNGKVFDVDEVVQKYKNLTNQECNEYFKELVTSQKPFKVYISSNGKNEYII